MQHADAVRLDAIIAGWQDKRLDEIPTTLGVKVLRKADIEPFKGKLPAELQPKRIIGRTADGAVYLTSAGSVVVSEIDMVVKTLVDKYQAAQRNNTSPAVVAYWDGQVKVAHDIKNGEQYTFPLAKLMPEK